MLAARTPTVADSLAEALRDTRSELVGVYLDAGKFTAEEFETWPLFKQIDAAIAAYDAGTGKGK